jgi:hypothetical protein
MSFDKTSLLKIFNDHFIEFIEDIVRVFPNDNDLMVAKNSLILMKKANPKLIIQVFYHNVYLKYNHKFEENNLDYFIDKDYQDDLTECNNAEKIIQCIDRLRNSIRMMNPDDKQKTIKYLQNLCKLSNSYIN